MEMGVEGCVDKMEKQRMGHLDHTILYEKVFQLKINAPSILKKKLESTPCQTCIIVVSMPLTNLSSPSKFSLISQKYTV